MFSLGIRYLNGWALAAADGAEKQRAEWPPHPDRVFMALAAAWFETDREALEGEALQWLAQQPPPSIAAPDAEFRVVVTSYVPANDSALASERKRRQVLGDATASLKGLRNAGLEVTPDFRPRQERSFPVAVPHVDKAFDIPTVHLIWTREIPEGHRGALASLCRKVTSVGHSASLVQIWLEDSPPPPTLVPSEGVARHRLRVFGPGRMEYLKAKCGPESHLAKVDALWDKEQVSKSPQKLRVEREVYLHGIVERLRPDPGRFQGYDAPAPQPSLPAAGSVFDPRMIVFALYGHRLSLPATVRLTEALRAAVMKAGPQPPPEWLSGHAPDGSRSQSAHLAFLPLPFVGRENADGRLMGIALALPRDLDPDEADRALGRWVRDEHGLPRRNRLFDGRWFECEVELETRESPPFNLRSETWSRPSAAWGSVTPVVLDRHFDGRDKWERAADNVKDACERIGLPRPERVLLHPVSMFEGVPRSNGFTPLTRKKDGGRMHHSHAVIVFGEPVEGPVLVGAGRYRGYGLCRPLAPSH